MIEILSKIKTIGSQNKVKKQLFLYYIEYFILIFSNYSN